VTEPVVIGPCRLYLGDALNVLPGLGSGSVDAVVADAPYELGFMGRAWDASGIAYNVDLWREVLRLLKPGGHLLAFGGTRTYHRLACAVEDAGFEVRDQIGWLYGSGFPKSLDVSKAIDKAAGAERELRVNERWAEKYPNGPGGNLSGDGRSAHFNQAKRIVGNPLMTSDPATDEARQWQGWGTALKPAWEPIVVARKPLVGTVAQNVQKHGTGAINVDGCRVPTGDSLARPFGSGGISAAQLNAIPRGTITGEGLTGRWPANVIHDGSEEVLEAFAAFGERKSGGMPGKVYCHGQPSGFMTENRRADEHMTYGDSGSAARFFMCCPWSEADEWHRHESNGQPVSDAGSPSRKCETPTADDPAATKTSASKSEASPVSPASTGSCKSSTPTPSHAAAGNWDGTGTIPTTASLSKSFGSALHVTGASINPESLALNTESGQRRFFYAPKASKSERGEGNTHPTVKPLSLARYLCRLVTPPGGTVLTPFMGSGTEVLGAVLEGFNAIGIEREPEYFAIAERRLAEAVRESRSLLPLEAAS
jgi:DNA modification methylase